MRGWKIHINRLAMCAKENAHSTTHERGYYMIFFLVVVVHIQIKSGERRRTNIKIVLNDRRVLDIQSEHTEMLDDESRTINKIGHIILISPDTCKDTWTKQASDTENYAHSNIHPLAIDLYRKSMVWITNKTTEAFIFMCKSYCVLVGMLLQFSFIVHCLLFLIH